MAECKHKWVLHMIQMPGGYEKPGATICDLCGEYQDAAGHQPVVFTTTTPDAGKQSITWIPSVQSFCTWHEDSDGNWDTGCGQKWILNDGTPIENKMMFCPCCGKRLAEIKYQDTDVV
jgi:hypothetical protein